jgi:hypothetical protein
MLHSPRRLASKKPRDKRFHGELHPHTEGMGICRHNFEKLSSKSNLEPAKGLGLLR